MRLTANPSAGFRFLSWSGKACAAQGSTCTFAASASETDTASFVAIDTVIASAGSNGTVAIADTTHPSFCTGLTCAASAGDAITITAAPSGGFHFVSWIGGSCTGQHAACTFHAASDENDTATFASGAVTIDGAASPVAGGTATVASGACKAASCSAVGGSSVTITATPAAGYRFTGWSGVSCSGATNPCAFTAAQSESDTALFVARFTVSATASSGGSVSVSDPSPAASCSAGSCTVDAGDAVTINAAPGAGFGFAGWSGGSCPASADPCVLHVTANETDLETFVLPNPGNPVAAVFVSPAGADANAGTESAPVRTPARALAIIGASHGAKSQMWLAQGSYTGPLDLTSADDGVLVVGGFDPSNWSPSAAAPSATTISGAPAAVVARGSVAILRQVQLDGVAPAPHKPRRRLRGASVYGILDLDKSSLTLTEVVVKAAPGVNGAAGHAGRRGAPGRPGGNGGPGQTPAQVAAACHGRPCRPRDGRGGAAGAGVNGNNYYLRSNAAYKSNPLLMKRLESLPLPKAGPSAGDGGFGGWGETQSPATPQGCHGVGAAAAVRSRGSRR